MDPYAVFNRKLLDFVEGLETLHSGGKLDIPQVETLRPLVMMGASMDPTKPQSLFELYVARRYGDQIMKQDEQFLMEASFDDVCDDVDPGCRQMDLVGMLKGAWSALSAANKDAIWKHLQVLMVLNKRCQDAASSPSGNGKR